MTGLVRQFKKIGLLYQRQWEAIEELDLEGGERIGMGQS